MKIRFILFITFLLYAVSATAQMPLPSAEPAKNKAGNFSSFTGSKISTLSNSLWVNNSANCSDTKSSFAPEAITCNGASVTSITFNNASRTVVSGTNNTVGVVYRYTNAGTAPDGTVLDALVTVQSYSNNHDATPATFSNADTDSVGFSGNLQPSINQESGVFTSNSPWLGSITYRIQFVVTGTTTPKVITVAATSIDNDGSGACGGLREAVTYSTALNQVLTTLSTQQVLVGNTVTGPQVVHSGIGTGADFANAALYVNVSEFNWTYSFSTSGNCTNGASSEVRYGSLNLSCQIPNFGRNFASVALGGRVYNDYNGAVGGVADLSGTNAGGLFANLLDTNNNVVSSVAVAADGSYSFSNVVEGNYVIQITTLQGIESNPAPDHTLPAGWGYTGENLGAGTGNDGLADGFLAVTVGSTAVTNANFGIQQLPIANNNTAATQNNPGGTTNVVVPAGVFTASDPSPGTVVGIRIIEFPTNVTTITINGTQYTSATFPAQGVIIPTNAAGNPTQEILIDPVDGAVTVSIRFVAIDNGDFESAKPATVEIPFVLIPTAANAEISGTLYFGGSPLRNTLVVLTDTVSNSKIVVRTDAEGNYVFRERQIGKTYLIQPLSSKYAFSPAANAVNLTDNVSGLNFSSTAKNYRVKNDFDGDGKSDVAVFRPSDGNWYVLRSGDNGMSVFKFGFGTDIPVSADFDGDGKTDYAVFRPSDGNWYIWQSETEDLRVVRFGMAGDKLVPADYDGDGKDDIAVYRGGFWYILNSSDGSFTAKHFGAETDTPMTGDFDGDGKADIAVYRSSEGNWYMLSSSNNEFSASRFGLETDVPAVGDFDGDGRADIAQFRKGNWYVLNSTTDFEAYQFGSGEEQIMVGDYDGDGRSDAVTFHSGLWSIADSAGAVRNVYFGLPTDIPVK